MNNTAVPSPGQFPSPRAWTATTAHSVVGTPYDCPTHAPASPSDGVWGGLSSVALAGDGETALWASDGADGAGLSRPEAGLERTGVIVVRPGGRPEVSSFATFAAPLGDLSAFPEKSRFAVKLTLSVALRSPPAYIVASQIIAGLWATVAFELAKCGVAAVLTGADIEYRKREGDASKGALRNLAGVLWCNRHVCPSCGSFATARRREALEARAAEIAHDGRHFHMVATLRHHKGVRWLDLAEVIRSIWRAMVQDKNWSKWVKGYVWQNETTESDANGIHHHRHIIITLKFEADSEKFKNWVEEFWRKRAKECGRSAEWADGWWSEIAPEKLVQTARYLLKHGAGENLAHVAAAEVLGGTAKEGAALWDLPLSTYVEIWHDSKGHHWFAAGGIWKSKAVAAVETDEGAAAARDRIGTVLASTPRPFWRSLPLARRRWVAGLLANREVDHDTFLTNLRAVLGDDNVILPSTEGDDAAGVLVAAPSAEDGPVRPCADTEASGSAPVEGDAQTALQATERPFAPVATRPLLPLPLPFDAPPITRITVVQSRSSLATNHPATCSVDHPEVPS